MPPLPPILTDYTRSADGLTGSVQVSQVEPSDMCMVMGIGLARPPQANPISYLGFRQGSGPCTLDFGTLAERSVMVMGIVISAQGEGALAETALGPLPRIQARILARCAPEIVRR